MGDLIIRNILVIFVISAMVISGFSIFLIDMAGINNVELDGNLTDLYGEMNGTLFEASDTSDSMQSQLEDQEGASGTGGEILSTTKVLSVVTLPFDLLKSSTKAISIASKTIGVPTWFTVGIITILIILVSAIILSAITRYPN